MHFVAPNPSEKAAKIAALKAKAKAAAEALAAQTKGGQVNNPDSTELQRIANLPAPEACSDKLRIVFDNSGSMWDGKLDDAKAGVVEFIKNCNSRDTAIAIHLLNDCEPRTNYGEEEATAIALRDSYRAATLSTDLMLIAAETQSEGLYATGGTPLYEKSRRCVTCSSTGYSSHCI